VLVTEEHTEELAVPGRRVGERRQHSHDGLV